MRANLHSEKTLCTKSTKALVHLTMAQGSTRFEYLEKSIDDYIIEQQNKNTRAKTTRDVGVANGTSKNVGVGKFWQDLEISEAFLISLEVSFLYGLFLLSLSLETFYQRV